jgi:hypothetical protein
MTSSSRLLHSSTEERADLLRDHQEVRPLFPAAIGSSALPPEGSADRIEGRRPRDSQLDRLDPGLRHSVRRLLALMCLLPLLALLAPVVLRFVEDPIVLSYGVGVLMATIACFYLAYTRYDDPADPRFSRVPNDVQAPALPATPRVTLLVAVMNEVDVIDACVRSMVGCDYPDVQVIVVDDASTDGTGCGNWPRSWTSLCFLLSATRARRTRWSAAPSWQPGK